MRQDFIVSQSAGFFNTSLLISAAGERLAPVVLKWL
jgi:hypothetical protein